MTNPQPVQKKRQLLDADELGPMDMLRARKRLGIDGYRLVDDNVKDVSREERTVFLIWCFESRADPEFTYEQAERVTFRQIMDRYLLEGEDDETEAEGGDGAVGDEVPPSPPADPATNGAAPPKPKRAASPSRKKRSGSGSAPSVAASTT